MVWQRLLRLRADVVRELINEPDVAEIHAAAERWHVPEGELPLMVYELLRRAVRAAPPLRSLGLGALEEEAPLDVLNRIDQLVYERSLAAYEHSFRVNPR